MMFRGGDQKGGGLDSVFGKSEAKTHNGDGPAVAAGGPVTGEGAMHELGHVLGVGHTMTRSDRGGGSSASGGSSGATDMTSLMSYPTSPYSGMF